MAKPRFDPSLSQILYHTARVKYVFAVKWDVFKTVFLFFLDGKETSCCGNGICQCCEITARYPVMVIKRDVNLAGCSTTHRKLLYRVHLIKMADATSQVLYHTTQRRIHASGDLGILL